jgi:hypothetical protein
VTSPVFIRPVTYPRFCRLLVVGVTRHVTACRGSLDVDEPLLLTATEPPPELLCSACGADLSARRQRTPTRDLGPAVLELGVQAEVEVEQGSAFDSLGDELPRVTLGDLRDPEEQ